jgi:hypothetical protein
VVLGKLYIHTQKTDPHLSPCIKINSKWFWDLDVRPGTETTRRKLRGNTSRYGIGRELLNRTLMSAKLIARTGK